MMLRRVSVMVAALMLLVTIGQAQAVSVTLGTQDFFVDGAVVGSAAFSAAAAGEPAPFDQIYGADSAAGPDFSKSWTFTYTGGLTILSASLTLGIWDNDSAAPGSQVNSFTLDTTNNLTTVLDTAFEASPGASNQIKIYTIVLPPTTFADLGDGSATFSLTLQNATNVLNQTVHNGAGLDFSRLDITTPDDVGNTVPEPSTLLLLASGLSGLAGYAGWRRT